jgi:ankyrin repeat protein
VTPLSLAAKNGYNGELLDRVCTKNQENIDRLTALCLAARENHRKVVKLFIEKNTTTVKKNKHLFQVASEGSKKRLRCLIRIGADVNATGEDGETLSRCSRKSCTRIYQDTLHDAVDSATVVYMGIDYVVQGK